MAGWQNYSRCFYTSVIDAGICSNIKWLLNVIGVMDH